MSIGGLEGSARPGQGHIVPALFIVTCGGDKASLGLNPNRIGRWPKLIRRPLSYLHYNVEGN